MKIVPRIMMPLLLCISILPANANNIDSLKVELQKEKANQVNIYFALKKNY